MSLIRAIIAVRGTHGDERRRALDRVRYGCTPTYRTTTVVCSGRTTSYPSR